MGKDRTFGNHPMEKPMTRFTHALTLTLVFSALSARGDDWPQWRGPTRDGVWRETGLVERFSESQLPVKWRAEVSGGYSGPTVADGRVYVTDRVTDPEQRERVLCFDADSGAPVWQHAYDCAYNRVGYEAGPRACVSIEEGRAYSVGTMGHLFCLDAATGEVLWRHDLDAEYKLRFDGAWWGVSASPLVEGDLVIVQVGGEKDSAIVAFDKRSGQERWRALDEMASYSSPIVIEQAGRRVLACWTGGSIAGLDPASGEVFWRVDYPPRRMVLAVASPVVEGDYLFTTGFYDGSMLLRLGRDEATAEQVYHRRGRSETDTDALHSIISTPLLIDGYVYGVDSYGELRCLDVASGDRVWESGDAVPGARWSTIHFVRNGDAVWMFNERGELVIARLSPQGYEEIDRAKLIEPTTGQLEQRGGVCWAHPAFAGKCVFARNDKELVCADLSR